MGAPGRNPALDGVRAVATIAVLISHFFPERSPLGRAVHWGRFGVLLFFVLSGLLITRLLLAGRESVERGEATRGEVFRAFFLRRALRIMPIYYIVVLAGAAIGYRPIADYLFAHLTYTGNVALAYFGAKLAQATHLWSLCIEEQFYLVWPLAALWLKTRRLMWLCLALALTSYAYEWYGASRGRSWEQTHLVLQGCMDALGLGALLAAAEHVDRSGRAAERTALACSLFGVPLLFLSQGYRYGEGPRGVDDLLYRLTSDPGLGLVSVGIVHLAANQARRSLVSRFLAWTPLVALGRISYGVYLYHLFLIAIGRWLHAEHGGPEIAPGPVMFFLYSTIAIAVAALSWRFIEAPINAWKDKIPYPPRRPLA
jgi:peptidoglycan/LPS O-acetylase OafA/YrhL